MICVYKQLLSEKSIHTSGVLDTVVYCSLIQIFSKLQDLNKPIRKHIDRHMMKRSHRTPDNIYSQLSCQTNQPTTDLVFGNSYLIEYPKPIYSDLLSKYLTLRGLGVHNHNIVNIKVEKISLLKTFM